jgi:phospholipid N-methyltransferase
VKLPWLEAFMPLNCHAVPPYLCAIFEIVVKDWIVSMNAVSATACSDFVQFFRSWITNPRQVSAIAPSGETLARIMTREIAMENGRVLELGPGTGVFTRALLSRGIDEADLTLIEFGSEFADVLKKRFPHARVLQMDASRIAQCGLFENSPFGAVVSGLPLLSMPPLMITGIVGGAFSVLKSGGAFYQFTYGPRCPVPRHILDRLGLEAIRVGGTVRNLPPASVYRISRRKPLEVSPRKHRYRSRDVNADIATLAAELAARSNAMEAAGTESRL